MAKEIRYRPGELNIIWDIFPHEFDSNGHLEQFIQIVKQENFDWLLNEELKRVAPFLEKWGELLQEISPINSETLKEWFLKTPKLSGVIYFSHSTVISELFFSKNNIHLISHPTDRIICQEAINSLPSAKDLTFSFPRKYSFDGFYNSWGFIRIERQDENLNGAGIVLSVVTLDSEIMDLMRKHDFKHLAYLYNKSWDYSVHDYIHHLALYTNPSFGIGKLSPMSIYGQHHAIDQWGEDMVNTFNYEYWAHRTHRLITEKLTYPHDSQILLNAQDYFLEIKHFQECLISHGYQIEYIQKVGQYLGCIFLWPLHILKHPHASLMHSVRDFAEGLYLPEKQDRIKDTISLLQEINYPSEIYERAYYFLKLLDHLNWEQENPLLKKFNLLFEKYVQKSISNDFLFDFLQKTALKENPLDLTQDELSKLLDINQIILSDFDGDEKWLRNLQIAYLDILSKQVETPLQKGISIALKALKIDLKMDQQSRSLSKYEWLCLKTEITVQRGMYNCWEHEHAVIYQQKPTSVLKIFQHFFELLEQTYNISEHHLSKKNNYKLSGIIPHAFNNNT